MSGWEKANNTEGETWSSTSSPEGRGRDSDAARMVMLVSRTLGEAGKDQSFGPERSKFGVLPRPISTRSPHVLDQA